MGNYQHIWILRRIFGNQPVGCVGRPSRPKAGIGAQVIRASSSDWTFRGPSVVHCRLGKSDDRGYRAPYYSTATVEAFQPYSTPPVSRNSPQPPPPHHATPSQGPAIVRTSSPVLPRGKIFRKSPFPNGNSEEHQCPLSALNRTSLDTHCTY
jgi:hypothetical protein